MTERQTRPINGEFFRKPAYSFYDAADYYSFRDMAIESIDSVLSITNPVNYSANFSSYEKGVSRREMSVSDFVETNGVATDIATEVIVRTSNTGHIRYSAEIDFQETVGHGAFRALSEYVLEEYVGGDFRATVRMADPTKDNMIEEHAMLPYDFYDFFEKLEVIAAMRKGIFSKGYENEHGQEAGV